MVETARQASINLLPPPYGAATKKYHYVHRKMAGYKVPGGILGQACGTSRKTCTILAINGEATVRIVCRCAGEALAGSVQVGFE
jgi:hypothetical protein